MTLTRRPDRAGGASPSGPTPGRGGRRSGRTSVVARLLGSERAGEWLVLVPAALLALLGVAMVYSASTVETVTDGHASWSVLARQVAYLAGAVGAAFVVSRIPLRIWRDRLVFPVYAAAVGAMVTLFVAAHVLHVDGLAVSANGATRWLAVGPVQFQPSELAKPALVLWLARLLSTRGNRIDDRDLLIPVLVGFAVLAVLVLSGDDLGTTVLLGLVMLTMLYLSGAPTRTVVGLGGAMAGLGIGALLLLDGFRLKRLAAFLHPEKYRLTEAWQLHQSQIGLASGGLFGVGPGYSRAKWGYLGTEAHTDFILAVIGEELGLVGVLFVIVCFVAVMVGGSIIASRCEDQFGRLVAFGVTAWLGLQALINIGVTVGTLPTKGITLPFVSFGGSSLLVSMVGLGLLLSVARDR